MPDPKTDEDYGCECPQCGARMIDERELADLDHEYRCPEHGWINEYDVWWGE